MKMQDIQRAISEMPIRPSSLNDEHFDYFSKLIEERIGIHLNKSKKQMVESRLFKRLRELNINSYEEYRIYLEKNPSELIIFQNCLTTNKTEFFREPEHFDYFKNHIYDPKFKTHYPKDIRIWSAASSSGEEAYTTAILLKEFIYAHPEWNYKILGTDINTEVVKKASLGVYTSQVIENLPPDLLKKYFLTKTLQGQRHYKVNDTLKNDLKFRIFNLVEDDLPSDLHFDFIFLRNVLIYFSPKTIQLVISKLSRHLTTGGHLIIGHSETLNNINHTLQSVRSSIYKKAS